MKQVNYFYVWMLLVCMLFGSVAQAQPMFQKKDVRNPHSFISTPDSRAYNASWGLAKLSQDSRQRKAAVLGTPADTVVSDGFGFLVGPDGSDWLFIEEVVNNDNYGISKSTFHFYDATNTLVGSATVEVEEGRMVNAIYPYGVVSNKFFDRDASTYEILIYEHEVFAPGVTGEKVYVYNTKGERVNAFDGGQAALFHVQQTSYDSYDRMLLMGLAVDTVVDPVAQDTIYESYYKIDIYKALGYSDSHKLEKTFKISEDLVVATVGSFINTYEIDGVPYYMIAHYEKPFFNGEWDWNVGQQFETLENNFIVTVMNTEFDTVAELNIPCDKVDDASRMYGCGFLTYDDFSKGLYSGDDDFNFVVTMDEYQYLTDDDKFTFDVYNSKSEKIRTIDSDVDAEGIMMLNEVAGHETQWAFGHTTTDKAGNLSSVIKLVNIPSCEVAHVLVPSEELPLTFTMNRYAKDGSYQYAIAYNIPEIDANNNVLGLLGWFNADLTLDHVVKFNIGPNGLLVQNNLTATALNPFLFNTDNNREYAYLANVDRADGSNKKDIYLNITDHEGKLLKSYLGDDKTKGAIRSVGFMNALTANSTMYIAYANEMNKYTIELVKLPMENFMQGSGTEQDPYLVSTRGDLMQIEKEPTAYYKQVNDIDMSITGDSWNAIPSFRGVYDGGNYQIRNLLVGNHSADQLALFGEISEATIKDMVFVKPRIEVADRNAYVGTLAGYAVMSQISNIHVYDAQIVASGAVASPVVGGIVSNAAFQGSVIGCSFDGVIDVPSGDNVGGIVGYAGTSTPIEACAVTGSILGGENVGGIVGEQGMDVPVTNCHVRADITGASTIGGIIGWNDSRSVTAYNLVEGCLRATETSKWGIRLGGVIGSLSEDWTSASDKLVYSNVVMLDSISLPKDTVDATVNGIIGFSIENAEQEPGKDAFEENGLQNNYINLAAYAGLDTNTDGQLVSADTLNQNFFESLGFKYGESLTAPWENGTLPSLYYEDVEVVIPATGLRLNLSQVDVVLGDSALLKAYLEPFDATETLVWSSTDEEIVTVDNGLIFGLSLGKATVTVATEDGKFTAVCEVNVVEGTGVDNIEWEEKSDVRKVFENGAIYILRGNQKYAIDGRRIQ